MATKKQIAIAALPAAIVAFIFAATLAITPGRKKV